MGLPSTDDPLKVRESRVFLRTRIKEQSKNGKKYLFEFFLIFEIEEPFGRELLRVIKNKVTLC